MIPAFIILFREVLEMALILSLIVVSTRGVAGRNRYIFAGIGGGLLGSALVALFADSISNAFEGVGQEVFNGAVLLLASAMIGWTVVWMKRHGKALAAHIKQVGVKVTNGDLPMRAIAVVVALSMWREGAEVVLFMTGILSTSQESLAAIMMGALGGAAAAGAIGAMLYLGLIRLSPGMLFSVTGWMLTLLACGMALQAAGFFAAAGVIPELHAPLWDTGWLLSADSVVGRILQTLVGYTERPSLMQVVWFGAALAVILAALRFTRASMISPSVR